MSAARDIPPRGAKMSNGEALVDRDGRALLELSRHLEPVIRPDIHTARRNSPISWHGANLMAFRSRRGPFRGDRRLVRRSLFLSDRPDGPCMAVFWDVQGWTVVESRIFTTACDRPQSFFCCQPNLNQLPTHFQPTSNRSPPTNHIHPSIHNLQIRVNGRLFLERSRHCNPEIVGLQGECVPVCHVTTRASIRCELLERKILVRGCSKRR